MQRADEGVAFAGGERGAWAKTVLFAVLVPVLGFLLLAWRTSDSGEPRRIRSWVSQADEVSGDNVLVEGRARLEHRVEEPVIRFSRLTFDLRVLKRAQGRASLRLLLEHRRGADEPWLTHDLSDKLRPENLNQLEVSVDDVAGLSGSRELALVIETSGVMTVAVENAELEPLPFGSRCSEMFASLTTPERLGQYGNNFVVGPRLAGRAWSFVLWISLGVLIVQLVLRRWLSTQPLRLSAHVALSALVLFMLQDARNHVDLWKRVSAATAWRAKTSDIYEYHQRGRDASQLGPILRYLAEELPEGSTYFVSMLGETRHQKPDVRTRYLGLPAQWAESLDEADVVIAVGPPNPALARGGSWRLVRRLSSTMQVFERP